MEVDVLVVGSGPAGSSFARVASQNGLSVLMVDKRKDIGSPVRCGEALGISEPKKQQLELPKEVYSTEIYGAKLVAPNGKEIVWKKDEPEGWILERKMFDRWLAELAISSGAKLKMYTRAVSAKKEDNGWVVKLIHGAEEEQEVRAKLIVSAEGMEALFARSLGFKTAIRIQEVDTCYEYEVDPYYHENLIELYFGKNIAPRGYVWIFPKANNKANVGIGIGGAINNANKHGISGAYPKPLLDNFMLNNEQLRDSSTLHDFGGVISVGLPINGFVRDNALVIGTAARQVDPIHGGGIAMAMEAGVLAAKVVSDSFPNLSKDSLYKYESIWRSTTGKKVNERYKLRNVLESLSDDDLNYIFEAINEREVFDIMDGKFAGVVAKIIAGRPLLLQKLASLLS